ncbi:Uncharacterised protein [Chlamydia trachomatis]|nr:Uncharacterised protein [Chlamydia trachomatis]
MYFPLECYADSADYTQESGQLLDTFCARGDPETFSDRRHATADLSQEEASQQFLNQADEQPLLDRLQIGGELQQEPFVPHETP